MGQWSTRNIVDLLKSKNVAIANSAGQSYGNVRKDEGIQAKKTLVQDSVTHGHYKQNATITKVGEKRSISVNFNTRADIITANPNSTFSNGVVRVIGSQLEVRRQ